MKSTLLLAAATVGLALPSATRAQTSASTTRLDTAVVAGGCFWSMERPFEHMPGVVNVTVGYSGGDVANPTYEQVSTGKTGHLESVQVVFNPKVVTYEQILDRFWHNIDPLAKNGQFCDTGPEYQTAIFVTRAQAKAADSSSTAVGGMLHGKVTTVIRPQVAFYPAESYHQNFADRNPDAYNRYRKGCRRDQRLQTLWGASAEPGVPPL